MLDRLSARVFARGVSGHELPRVGRFVSGAIGRVQGPSTAAAWLDGEGAGCGGMEWVCGGGGGGDRVWGKVPHLTLPTR